MFELTRIKNVRLHYNGTTMAEAEKHFLAWDVDDDGGSRSSSGVMQWME